MRKVLVALAVVALALTTTRPAQAQVQIGPTVGWHDDFDLGIGGTLMVQMPDLGEEIGFMGDFLVFFPDADGLDYFEINANVTYDFPLENSTVVPFALGGINIARASVDTGALNDVSDTEFGLNLGGGLAFDMGSVRPVVGGRFELDGGDGFVLFFTVPFEVAGG